MKLLSKSEIFDKKSSERKMEIEEGLKLAKKIDVLRETAAKEETKLAKFREATLRILKEDINTLIIQKDGLMRDIVELEDRKAELRSRIESTKLIN